MNHAAICDAEAQRPYTNRAYVGVYGIDHATFGALNQDGHVLALAGYCLDALDEVPAGCMCQFANHPAQHYVSRGVSLKEQEARRALAKRLIEEVVAEELLNGSDR